MKPDRYRLVALGFTVLASLSLSQAAAGAWEGEGCVAAAELRALVDTAYSAVPAGEPFGDGRGSSAAGFSAAVLHDDCGLFAYVVGQRDVESGKAMKVSTRHHVGSLPHAGHPCSRAAAGIHSCAG